MERKRTNDRIYTDADRNIGQPEKCLWCYGSGSSVRIDYDGGVSHRGEETHQLHDDFATDYSGIGAGGHHGGKW